MNAISPIMAASDSDAERIVKRMDRLQSRRSNFESIWRTISDVIRPMRLEIGREKTPGTRRHAKIYDSTPLTAHSSFAGGMYGMMTNPANRWFELRIAGDEDLNEFEPVKAWRMAVTDRIALSYSTAVSSFYREVIPLYKDFGGFGNGVFYTAERDDQRIHDRCRALSECYADVNEWDEIDVNYRKFKRTARQAVAEFGEDGVSQNIRNANEKNPEEEFWFVHAVEPNGDMVEGRAGPAGKAFTSIYVEYATKRELRRGGFHEFPFHWPRWELAAGEIYGRGIGEQCLADVLTLHAMARTNLTAGQRAADPPLNAFDERVFGGQIKTYPSAINYGGLSQDGRPRIAPLYTGMQLPISLEMQRHVQEQVKDGWFFALMQMVQTPNQTATEYLGRQEEKLRLMAPHLGQIETEFLAPSIKRRFGILWRAGQLPPPPDELVQSGQDLEVEFVSPLARMQKTIEANAAIRTAQTAGDLEGAGISGLVDRIDPDELAETVAAGFGATRVLRSREEAEKLRAERAQRAQMQQMAEAAPGVAKAGKDAVDAAIAYNGGGGA